MTFLSGNLSTTTTTPALDFVNLVEGALPANGYSLADSFTDVSTGTIVRVWLCPANNSTAVIPWYFSIARSADSATALTFQLGQTYDSASRTFSKYVWRLNSATSRAYNTDGTVVGSVSVITPNANAHYCLLNLANSTPGTPLQYVLSISAHRLALSTSAAQASTLSYGIALQPLVYLGCFDTLISTAVASDVGLGLLAPTNSSGTSAVPSNVWGCATQDWKAGATTAAAFSVAVNSVGWTTMLTAEFYSGRPVGSRATLLPGQSTASGLRGLLRDVLITPALTGFSYGDELAFTLNGVTTTYMQAVSINATHSLHLPENV